MLFKIAEGFAYKSCHTETVGFDGGQLLAGIEGGILIPDTRTMEIQVHASQFADEFMQAVNGLDLRLDDIFLIRHRQDHRHAARRGDSLHIVVVDV